MSFYEPVAHSLLAGKGLVQPNGQLAVRYPPGHVAYLAVVFLIADLLGLSDITVLQVASSALHALSVLLLFLLMKAVWGRKRAVLAALLYATYLPALWLTAQAISETTFIPFLLGALLLYWKGLGKPKWRLLLFFLAGVTLGVAMLIRPIGIGLPLVLAIGCLILFLALGIMKGVIGTVALLAGSLVVVIPWEVWVYQELQTVIMLSSGGLPTIIDGLTFARPRAGWDPVWVPKDSEAFMIAFRNAYDSGQINTMGEVVQYVGSYFWAEPLAMMKLYLLKLARCWYATDSHRYEFFILILQMSYLGLGFWGGVRAWKAGGHARRFVIISVLVIAYFWLMTTMALSIVRYMVPIMPLIFALIPLVLEEQKTTAGPLLTC